ncbi:MAG TPA: tetratricopeptide repeat protein [Candidatus Acidoferrales bacterium]|jgi:hypothetical protein|nr:tetratricopeptide repeat protein [Candidatus Acidoferrales bacterium]
MNHPSQTRALWAAVAGVPLLFAAIAVLQMKINAGTRAYTAENDELMLRSGSAVRQMSLGYDSLVADIYWTRAVQYYGSRLGTDGAEFGLLWPLLDIATTLDSKLIIAYRFGAIFLSEPPPVGAGRPDLAVELLKRGIAENPDNYYLSGDLGFLYYWRLKDYPKASEAYLEGSKIPNAPAWLKMMAARIAEQHGSLETSRMIWSQIYETSQEKTVRDQAMKTLRVLRAQEDEAQLDEVAQKYKNRFGHFPASASELRDAGLLRGTPVDPAGYPYIFGADGKSSLDPRSSIVIPHELNPPPEESK